MLVLAILAILLGIIFEKQNVAFMVSLAFAVATVAMVRMHLPTRDALDAAGRP